MSTSPAVNEHWTRPSRGDGLLSTTALAALFLWLLNDHVLKSLTPGVLTGKLSDVASLIVLPIALQAAYELTSRRIPFVPSRASILTACFLVGAFFVWMETTQLGSLAFRSVLAVAQWPLIALRAREWVAPRLVAHIADWEDLLTLPALLLPYRVGTQRVRRACAESVRTREPRPATLAQRASSTTTLLIVLIGLAYSWTAQGQDVLPDEPTPTCEAESRAHDDAQGHLQTLQLRRDELHRRARGTSFPLPIAGVALGFGGAVLSLDSDRHPAARGLGAAAASGLAVASAVWLGLRVHTRRSIRADLHRLQQELEPVQREVSVAASTLAGCQARQNPSVAPPEALATTPLPPLHLAHDPVADARRARYRLGPPIALLVVGYAGALISTAVASWTWWFYAPSFELDEEPTATQRRIMRGFGGSAIAGAVIGSVALGWLIQRVRLRRMPVQQQTLGPRRREVTSPTLRPEFGRNEFSLSLVFAL